MTGKISDAEKNFKTGNKLHSNMVKISSSKSILSYQNGSALNVENLECTTDEGMPAEGYTEETYMSEDPFTEGQNLKSECIDLLRKKLISDLSLTVFSSDLENKLTKMEPIEISKERQSVIQKLVVQISQLSDAEKLLLYLKLPSSTSSPFDPLRQPLNPLGNRQEIQQTIVWIKTHLEEDSEISIPKQDVYDQYLKYCENVSMKPLSTADFGKVMKQVYPGVRPRRLGTRGNSRYCYSGMRNTCKLPTPILPQSSVDNSISNGCASEGSLILSPDGNKWKKQDKSKRKWASSSCRNDKVVAAKGSSCLPSEKSSTYNLKTAKRSKSQKEETECTNSTDVEKVKEEEVDLSDIKCEDCSDNSYSAFDLECGLHNDLGVYLKKPEKKEGDSTTNLRSDEDLTSSIASEEKQNGSKKMSFYSGELQNNTLLAEQQNSKASELGTILKENLLSSNKGDQTTKANISTNHISEATSVLERNKDLMVDKQKAPKAKIKRSAALSKATKNIKKSYVPIQPKPADALKLSVRFERNQIPSFDNKKESEGISLCEESDSQEPEEEIVRYFKHLDENDLNTNGLVDQAVKNIDSNTVQISSISQIVTNSRNSTTYAGSEEVLNQANQQILRSQSCFEEHRGVFNLDDKKELVYMPRSQSSVELPTSNDQAQQEATDSDSGLDGRKKKISHLKILLEKSISSDTKNPYSTLKNRSNMSSVNPVMPNAQNPITEPVSQVVSNESNFLLSNIKPVDRDLLKLNGLKVLSKGPSFVPQSPNTRTKYFSFTPISPGPQSPLKTLSASPFVSPRSTPVSRSKPNSHTDHFLSPSERKTSSIRQEGVIPKNEFLNENVYNFFKNLIENSNGKSPKPSTFAQGSRPRSYSSTNFYRSKARRNASKPSGFDRNVNAMPKNHVTPLAQTNYPLNSHFSSQPVAPNFVSCESLSNEVQKFLENNSKLAEGQAATIRSRSAPLNKMISESNWISNQISPLYSGYFNSGNSGEPGKLSNLVSNSHPNSPKDVTPNMSAFVTNGEIANLGSAPLAGEIFSGDPGIPQLNEQYFSGDFQRPNDENFAEGQPFSEDSAFSNKLDLNSSGTFDGAFASDSDPAIADNIKSYLPDFESLDNKSLAEAAGSGESVVQTDRKLFKNTLYEGGNDNLKDPVITSFKPVLMNEISSSPGSPVLNFFGPKMNEDSQQLIEFFNFED